jgi:hypothetical protein
LPERRDANSNKTTNETIMNTGTTYNPKVHDDSEEDEKHLALLIHQAGEDARVRTKKILDAHFKKLNDMIAEAVLSQKKSLPS